MRKYPKLEVRAFRTGRFHFIMDQKTDHGLLRKNDSGFFIAEHQDFFRSLKSTLESAIKLLNATSGKLFLKKADGRFLVVKKGKDELLPVERQIAINAINRRASQAFFRQEDITDRQNRVVGRTRSSYLVAPFGSEYQEFGAILLKEKRISGYFKKEDVGLINVFADTFSKLVEHSVINAGAERDGKGLLVEFPLALKTLMENNYLYRKNQEDAFQLAEIIKVSKMINSSLDLRSLLEAIMDSAKHVLKSEGASLMLIDRETGELFFNVISGEKERALKEIRIPMGVGIAGICAQEQKPFIINDAQNDSRVFKGADQSINFVTRNLLCAPLLVKNKIIGVIEVINSLGRRGFTEKDLELFMSFSDHAALAIHNRELIDDLKRTNTELKKRIHELSSLHEISKAILASRTEKDLFDSVVHILVNELEVERVSIMIYDEEEAMLEIVSHFGLPREVVEKKYVELSKTLAGLAYTENKSIFVQDIESSPYAGYKSRTRYTTGSFIIEPLTLNNRPFGLVSVGDKVDETPLREDDHRLVATVAAQIIKAYENFALSREMIEKKAAEKELEMASQIQKNILPKSSVESDSFEVGIKSVPAKTMGGDFYDYHNLDDDHFIYLIADVSGKSLPAALFMAVTSSILRTVFRTAKDEYQEPENVLNKANELIYETSESGMFVTTFLVRYGHKVGDVHYASAGHNEQIVFRQETGEVEFLRVKGSPLGVIPPKVHGSYMSGQVTLAPGDLLVLYTDGVVEAINEIKEEFGMERFLRVLRGSSNLHPEQIVKKVYREVVDFAGAEPQFDDFTLFILKRK